MSRDQSQMNEATRATAEDRKPVRRGRPAKPVGIHYDADVPRLKGCPDCGGRGYYLIHPFKTGGSNGAGGLGNMCHCLTCVDSKAYWDEFGELPPSVVADMASRAAAEAGQGGCCREGVERVGCEG